MRLIILLLVAVAISQTTCHHHLGKVVTSVSYGHIHGFLSIEQIQTQLHDLTTLYQDVEDALLTPAASRNFQKLREKHEFSLKKTMEAYDHLIDAFSPVTNVTDSSRHKRNPAVIAIGAVVLTGMVAISFGLSIANRVELNELVAIVEQQNEDIDKLLASIENNNALINENFEHIRHDIHKLAGDLTALQDSVILTNLNQKVLLAHEAFQLHISDLTTAVYMAYSGQLHPALMPISKLTAAFDKIRNMAISRGGYIVPTLQAQEVLFAMPVTIVTNTTGFHLLVPIPIIPAGMEVLDLYSLTAPTLQVDNHTTVRLEVGNGLIAASALRDTHVLFDASDFERCKKFKDYYFCGNLIHHKEPRSCKAAVLLHDQALMNKACDKTVLHSPIQVFQNETTLTLTSDQGNLLVKQRCPFDPTQEKVYKTTSHVTYLTIQRGCYFDTTEASYFPNGPTEIDVQTTDIISLDFSTLMGEIKREQIQSAIKTILSETKMTTLQTDFSVIKSHIDKNRAELISVGHWSLSSVAFALVFLLVAYIAGRYIYLKRQENQRNANEQVHD